MKALLTLLPTIESLAIRSKVEEFLTTKVQAYFTVVPASSSGRYHPKYCLGDGGLLRHTIAATKILNHMLALEFAQKIFTALQRDKMRAAIILHDTFKQGDGVSGKTVKNHELIAADEFNKFLGVPQSHIGQLMKTHMGQWGAQHPKNAAEYFVHLADYLASRKDIEVIQ
jgi:hypothetical protein